MRANRGFVESGGGLGADREDQVGGDRGAGGVVISAGFSAY